MKKFHEWLAESTTNIHIDVLDYENKLRNLLTKYIDDEFTEEKMENDLKILVDQTKTSMEAMKSMISSIVATLPSWHTNDITIEALTQEDPSFGGISIEPATSADIYFGDVNNRVSFLLSVHEGEVLIDDILEGGDKDFFHNDEIQVDYFSLISGLKNQGKKSKNKLLTLYTARPRADRKKILSLQQMPLNIFLTNDEQHAQGLARDLGGSSGERDLWMVKINSRYLTQTLDGPIKYYQLTTDEAPMDVFLVS